MFHKSHQPFQSPKNPDLWFNRDYRANLFEYTLKKVQGKLRKFHLNKNPVRPYSNKIVEVDCLSQFVRITSKNLVVSNKTQVYGFADVIDVVQDPRHLLGAKDQIYPKYSFEFSIEVVNNSDSNKIIRFACKSSDECDLWVHAFRWIVHCNCLMAEKMLGLDIYQQKNSTDLMMLESPDLSTERPSGF